jgi:hypothetical protein
MKRCTGWAPPTAAASSLQDRFEPCPALAGTMMKGGEVGGVIEPASDVRPKSAMRLGEGETHTRQMVDRVLRAHPEGRAYFRVDQRKPDTETLVRPFTGSPKVNHTPGGLAGERRNGERIPMNPQARFSDRRLAVRSRYGKGTGALLSHPLSRRSSHTLSYDTLFTLPTVGVSAPRYCRRQDQHTDTREPPLWGNLWNWYCPRLATIMTH